MKKFKGLNKLLLAGAALAGIVAPNVKAAVDIQVTGGPNALLAEYDGLVRARTLQNEINNLHTALDNRFPGELTINLVPAAALVANPEAETMTNLVQFATLKTLNKLTKTPIVASSLRLRANQTRTPFHIDFQLQNATNPTVGATTSHDSMSVFVSGVADVLRGGIPFDSLTGSIGNMSDLFVLSQLKLDRLQSANAPSFPQSAALLSYTVAQTAHELGHMVARVQTSLDSLRRTGVYRESDELTDAWIGAFFRTLYSRLEPVAAMPGGQYESLARSTFYAHSHIAERFAENFCEAALRSSHTGTGIRALTFDDVLTQVANCTGPHGESCLTFVPDLA